MPSYNLIVSPSSSNEGKAIFMGLLSTLPSSAFTDNVGDVSEPRSPSNSSKKTKRVHDALNELVKKEPSKKRKGKNQLHTHDEKALTEVLKKAPGKQGKGKKPFYIRDAKALDHVLEKQPGKIYLSMKTSGAEASKIKDVAMKSNPIIAAGIEALEAQGINYAIEVRRKMDSIKGGEDCALNVLDVTGLDEGRPLYRRALKNEAILKSIEAVCPKQVAAVKRVLTSVGDVAGVAPESPAKIEAVQFKFFLEEISEVLSSLKETNAPKELLLCAVPAVFAKYKSEYWDGVMTLAGEEAGKELQACADEILDPQHINNYLESIEKARWAPPGPSCEAFDVAFGLLSKVDQGTTSAFRDLIVNLHDTVKPRVDSLDKVRALRVNQEGLKDEEIKFQINQLDICTRNYLQCFHSIGQKFARMKDIRDMSVPDKKAQLQAVMREQISEVHWKFWPTLKTSLDKLCDPSVVKDIESKVQTLTEQLSDAQSATVKDSSYMSRLWSLAKRLMGAEDGVKGQDINGKDDNKAFSPMFFDLLKIVEQLETYGQVASSSPEESPHLPDTIGPGDRVAICGALGFVSKPKAAAIFTLLNRLQALLESVEYEAIASPEERASIEKFLNVDYHIVEAMEKEGHSFGVHGELNVEECNKIMTSTFERYLKDCWSHVAAVLEGRDQAEAAKDFKEMAADILNWKDPEQELDLGRSRIIDIVKRVANMNVAWYLTGMLQFVGGAPSEGWKWYKYTQDMWDNGICVKLRLGTASMRRMENSKGEAMVCLPEATSSNDFERLDLVAEQILGSDDEFYKICDKCCDIIEGNLNPWNNVLKTVSREYITYYHDGKAAWKYSNSKSNHCGTRLDEDGINLSCKEQFAARWYDASEQVIKSICNEAFGNNIIKYNYFDQESSSQLLRDEYEFHLLTGFQGPNFKSNASQSNYQGFVMCLDASTPTTGEVMKHISDPTNYTEKALKQRRCKWKTYNGEERDISIFYSTAKVEQDGKIYIHNPHHEGYIGDCYPRLLRESGIINATQEGIDQTAPLKELVRAFVKAENEGSNQMTDCYGDFVRPGNDTANWILAQQSNLQNRNLLDFGEPIEGCLPGSYECLGGLISYWPWVVGILGSAFTAKKVWNRYKAHPHQE